MSLNVAYNQINSGIDKAALKEVTTQIFQRANAGQSSSVLANADLTKFNRASLGTDLYSGKVSAAAANQIAMTKTDLQVTLSNNALNSLKYLNSEASKSIFKSVDGKINIPTTNDITEKQTTPKVFSFGKLTETADLGSDKRGSNPFYKGELLNIKKEEKENDDSLNIFA